MAAADGLVLPPAAVLGPAVLVAELRLLMRGHGLAEVASPRPVASAGSSTREGVG